MRHGFATNGWSARLWATATAGFCSAVAACANDPAVAPPPVVSKPVASLGKSLSESQVLRALRARNREMTGGTLADHEMIRVFDGQGHVLREVVLQGDHWQSEPSTIPSAIAARSLSSFVGGAALYDTTTTTVNTNDYTRTLAGQEVDDVDTVSTTPASRTQSPSHDTDVEGAADSLDSPMVADVGFYGNEPGVGLAENSTSAAIFVAVTADGGTEYVELDNSGGGWQNVIAGFQRDTAGLSSEWAGNHGAPPSFAVSAAIAAGMHPDEQAGNCDGEYNDMMYAAGGAILMIAAASAAWAFFPPAGPPLTVAAGYAVTAFQGTALLWAECEIANGTWGGIARESPITSMAGGY